ncbi:E3 ubiquitin-protein ligase siah2-like [Notamacropus eugenii]|uniref:E3 ubiquitin-protein ligase siah2-like n=1 Tax=Notamacropus eugenii TaxID=9315 RepID=UPI003B676C92
MPGGQRRWAAEAPPLRSRIGPPEQRRVPRSPPWQLHEETPAAPTAPSLGSSSGGLSEAASRPSATSAAAPGSSEAALRPGISGPQESEPITDLHHLLASLFECPVCFSYVQPPILQCQDGHLLCNPCREKVSSCPTCRGSLTPSIRNLAMEKVASAVPFPCKDTTSSSTVHHMEKPEYENKCLYYLSSWQHWPVVVRSSLSWGATDQYEDPFHSCPCPGSSCEWQGWLVELMSHLQDAHQDIVVFSGENIIFFVNDFNMLNHCNWVVIQFCFSCHFMVVLQRQEKYQVYPQFFALVLLIGTRRQAERFAYRLELNGQGKRLIWEATTLSIQDGVADAILNNKCLILDINTACEFAKNGRLSVYVTISTR